MMRRVRGPRTPAFPGDRDPRGSSTRAWLRFVTTTLVAATLLSACVTPPAPGPVIPESLLLVDYSSWFAADVGTNRELLDYVLDELGSEARGAVGRTERIVGGMMVVPGGAPEVSAVATGSFPTGGVEFVLSSNASFERERAQVDGRERTFFRQREGLLQVAVPGDDTLYVSSGRVLEMLRSRPPAELSIDPGVYRDLRRVGTPYGPAATVIFDDPGAGMLASLGVQATVLPLTRIDLALTTAPLELGGTLHLRTERDAALFGRIGRLFVLLFVRALGLDSEAVQEQARISVEGSRLVFTGIPVSSDELVEAIRRLAGGTR